MIQRASIGTIISEKTRTHQLLNVLSIFGWLNVICFIAYAICSYGLAPVGPDRRLLGEQFSHVGEAFGSRVQMFLSGESFARPEIWLLAYCTPLVISTLVFLGLLIRLARHHRDIDPGAPRALFRWAAVFAAVNVFARPVQVQDFWLSVAWGRMVGTGINPYHTSISQDLLQALPFDELNIRMTYGPLWALISGMVMWCAGNHWLIGAILFKFLLAGAWIGCLWIIWKLLRQYSLWQQCVGIAIFGWLPLSVIQTVADGHNDVFMVWFLLLWLFYLGKNEPVRASLSLAASATVKYITAPLFLLDLLHWRYSRKQSLSSTILQVLVTTAFGLIVFGIFYRSPEFFNSTNAMRHWLFFRPSDAVVAFERLTGIKLWYASLAVRALFPIIAVYSLLLYVRRPEHDNFMKATLAVISAILFSAVGHVWPWFVLWAIGLAALVPGSALTRWIIGVALASPFVLLVWVVFPNASHNLIFEVPALVLYTFVIVWFVCTPRSWFPRLISANELRP